jgi:hypothetical protein
MFEGNPLVKMGSHFTSPHMGIVFFNHLGWPEFFGYPKIKKGSTIGNLCGETHQKTSSWMVKSLSAE